MNNLDFSIDSSKPIGFRQWTEGFLSSKDIAELENWDFEFQMNILQNNHEAMKTMAYMEKEKRELDD